MSKRIHIIVAEPSTVIRSGMVAILQQTTAINSDIAELSDFSTLSTAVSRQIPDLIIVNPSHMGLFSPSQIRGDIGNENLKIIALQSTFMEQGLLQNYDEVISIYDTAETIIKKIVDVTDSSDLVDNKKELSLREKEIVVCVVKGLTNKQIADTLCLSTHTVIAHRRNIASKLQIHSPSGLTIYAIVNKLVDLSEIKNSISQPKEEA